MVHKMEVQSDQDETKESVSIDVKPSSSDLVKKSEKKLSTSEPLVELSAVNADNTTSDKKLITILSGGSELLDNEDSNSMDNSHSLMEEVDDVEDIGENLLEVKQEICEVKLEQVTLNFSYFMHVNPTPVSLTLWYVAILSI